MTVNELIKMLTQITLENKEYVEKRVKKLSEEQINWRPNPGVWNITEVLAHLNSYSEYYHSTFSKKIEKNSRHSILEEFTILNVVLEIQTEFSAPL